MMKTINIIPSKAYAHRGYICEALSDNKGEIICKETSEDIDATVACLKALSSGEVLLPCNESGSTLRFLLPVALALGKKVDFQTEGRLSLRPLSPLKEQLEAHGCVIEKENKTIKARGSLQGGTFCLDGNVSSQFISGLMFALPLLTKDSKIVLTSRLESKGYVHMTIKVLQDFSIDIQETKDGYFIKGNQKYIAPPTYNIEGDWSNGAFWLVAGSLMEEGLCCSGLNYNSLQGDRKIMEILSDIGANIRMEDDKVFVSKGSLSPVNIKGEDVPDLIPIIALIAAVSEGKSVIENVGRLRLKESDRLKTISETINSLGGHIEEVGDNLIVVGVKSLKGGQVDSQGDHRIAMMAAIASLVSREKVTITHWSAVNKSYPGFFQQLKKLGLDTNLEVK